MIPAFSDMHVMVIGGILIIALVVLVNIRQYLREREYCVHRSGWARDDFVSHFRAKNVPPEVAAGIYGRLRNWNLVKCFPVNPDDNLESVYQVGGRLGMPLCEFINEIGPDCGLADLTATQLSARIRECAPIVTVSDLVRLVSVLRDGKGDITDFGKMKN